MSPKSFFESLVFTTKSSAKGTTNQNMIVLLLFMGTSLAGGAFLLVRIKTSPARQSHDSNSRSIDSSLYPVECVR